jgi:4-amino-4-deoxy-L-arabinose transferase-like glycosyltransferase
MLRSYWSLIVIVGLGFLLRIALVVVSPPNLANDNHLDPIGIIVREGRIARPDECAQCYQPPLYYLICSGVYVIAERIQIERGANSSVAMITGFKAVQTVSAMAGTLTLLVCAFILRSTLKVTSHVEWLSLGVIALLPRHLYMSAMITNDALTYLAATLAIYFFLRTRTVGYSWSGCLLTGLTSGTAILSKGYGLVTTGDY